uniref:E3 ubiquitin-protein ligase parkin n=1 Tax=Clarias batrachus TaxID=59899 RepID=A0A386TLM4_CLABA|nr:E3 ubiquitin-protein ligase parkin [Clarias batrachus]
MIRLPDRTSETLASQELFSGPNTKWFGACDLPEQSTVHVVLPPAGSARRSELVLQRRLSRAVDSLTRLDLSSSRLPATSTGLAVILENENSHTQTEPRPHSTFYVFCKTLCKSVQPGKLRVRCRKCKQGTLTLSREFLGDQSFSQQSDHCSGVPRKSSTLMVSKHD